jgi:hypothetical protein
MNKIILLFIFTLSFFTNQEKFTEWTSESGDRKYVVRIYDKKINIKINEYEYSYTLINKEKFKMEKEYFYYEIKNNKLHINYFVKKTRIAVDEIVTLQFLKK